MKLLLGFLALSLLRADDADSKWPPHLGKLHFEIDMVDYPTSKDIKVTRNGGGWDVEAAYDDEAPLFANISLHVVFDKTVHTGGAAGP